MRILVVEDNPVIAENVREGLTEEGYVVDTVSSGFDAQDMALVHDYDLIILDVILPDRDGTDVCRELRRRGVATPILMATSLTSAADTVSGLDAGADDYLRKPYAFEELLARVRALLRRGRASESDALRFGDVVLDLHRRAVTRGSRTTELTSKEFALLECMLRHADRVVSKTVLEESVWGVSGAPDSNVLQVLVSALRRKVDRGHQPPLIHTVIGCGYRLGHQIGGE